MVTVDRNKVYIDLRYDCKVELDIMDYKHRRLSVYKDNQVLVLIDTYLDQCYVNQILKDLKCIRTFIENNEIGIDIKNIAEILYNSEDLINSYFNIKENPITIIDPNIISKYVLYSNEVLAVKLNNRINIVVGVREEDITILYEYDNSQTPEFSINEVHFDNEQSIINSSKVIKVDITLERYIIDALNNWEVISNNQYYLSNIIQNEFKYKGWSNMNENSSSYFWIYKEYYNSDKVDSEKTYCIIYNKKTGSIELETMYTVKDRKTGNKIYNYNMSNKEIELACNLKDISELKKQIE